MKNRRDFIKTCLGIAGAGWVTLKAQLASAKKLALSIDKVPALKKVGGWAKVKLAGKEVLLIRDKENSVKGLSPRCTHQDCPLKYNDKTKQFDCSCHGSSFDLTGKVLKGPATKNLAAYPTVFKDNRIVITIE